MKNIFARGGIEFLAVFLGIALSLWVDDYRESKELSNRLADDYKKIYFEVKSNIKNIENIISKNNDYILIEEELIDILNGREPYKYENVVTLIDKLTTPTYFGTTTAYRTSVASGRFNTSENDTLAEHISLLYEHYFVRLSLNGDLIDERMRDFEKEFAMPYFKSRYNQENIDTLALNKYFFSNTFHNGILYLHDLRKNWYMERLIDTKNQLYKVRDLLKP